MKENIFIEGDLVLYDNNVCKIEGKTLTCDTNLLEIYIVRTPNGCLYSIRPIEVTPIPIIPEILEKNGWKKSKINDCAYFYYKDGLFLTYTSKDGKFWFDDFDYSSSICVELPFVHSLQHLLFGLGIKNEMEV
jgi:hypothetical protein